MMERQQNIVEHLPPPCYHMTLFPQFCPLWRSRSEKVGGGGASGFGMARREREAEMDEKAKWK